MRKIFYLSVFIIALFQFSCNKDKKIKVVVTSPEKGWSIRDLELKATDQAGANCINIEPSHYAQSVDGFGGCFNELGWEALSSLPESTKDSIIQSLFDTISGCKFNICRMPVGANDYSVNWYSYDETPEDYLMKDFSIERDKQRLIPYIKLAKRFNPDLKIWASPWSPPAWMKVNKHYACASAEVNDLKPADNGKEMVTQFRMEPKILGSYALYFSKFIDAYRNENIKISAVHVQNEPNSCQNFPSCIWNPSDLAIFIGDYLGPAIKEKADIWLGTIERPNPERVDSILKNQKAKSYIKGVGFQWGGKGAIAYVKKQYPEMRLMQTETECGDGSNNWASAEHTFDLMKFYFENGANSYMYWNMILDETGKSQWGWKQNSMISIDKKNGKVSYNAEFFLMKHFSFYIKPEARVVNIPNPNALAFINPDKTIIVIFMNKEKGNVDQDLKINNKTYKISLAGKSLYTMVIQSE